MVRFSKFTQKKKKKEINKKFEEFFSKLVWKETFLKKKKWQNLITKLVVA